MAPRLPARPERPADDRGAASSSRSLAGKSFGEALPREALARPVAGSRRRFESHPHRSSQASARSPCAATRPACPGSLRASPRALADLARAARRLRDVFAAIRGRRAVRGAARARQCRSTDSPWTSARPRWPPPSCASTTGAVMASALAPQPAGRVRRRRHCPHPARAGRRRGSPFAWQPPSAAAFRRSSTSCSPATGLSADAVVTAAVAGNPTMLHAWAGRRHRVRSASRRTSASGRASCRAGRPTSDSASTRMPACTSFRRSRSHVGGRRGRGGRRVRAWTGADWLPASRRPGHQLGGHRRVRRPRRGHLRRRGPGLRGGVDPSRHAGRRRARWTSSRSPTTGACSRTRSAARPAAGICGSGLIDLVAEMLRVGLVAPSGYLRTPEEVAADVAAALRERIVEDVDGQQAFALSRRGARGAGTEIVLTARDIREVQLAKGSIMTAATLACRHLGLDVAALDEVLVAGAFGNYVRKSSALRIGLVPRHRSRADPARRERGRRRCPARAAGPRGAAARALAGRARRVHRTGHAPGLPGHVHGAAAFPVLLAASDASRSS